MNESPSVRGMFGLTSAMTVLAALRGSLRHAHLDAERAEPVLVGRADVNQRDVERQLAVQNRPGISDRKHGVKSARPSLTAFRTLSLTNSVFTRRWPPISGAV